MRELAINDFEIWDRVEFIFKYSRKELEPYLKCFDEAIQLS